MSILRLAIATPLRRLFDYLPPEGMDEAEVRALRPGIRLRVPFGTREVTGWLMAIGDHSELPSSSLKRVAAILDATPAAGDTLWQLCAWAAQYYHHPPGEVLAAAFPGRLRAGRERQLPGVAGWRLTARG